MTHPNVTDADSFAADANDELADLIGKATKPAATLTDYVAAAEVDVDRLALNGTDAQLEAWRSTRLADARLRELVALWRDTWRKVTGHRGGLPPHLAPKGLDVYGWEAPEACDHETVRLGATYRQRNGLVTVTPVHVDLIRVAQQPTGFRLLGPTAALELIGPDGIVQEAHPLRHGTRYAGADNAYRPTAPTWLAPTLEPGTPTRHHETSHDRAVWINRARADGRVLPDGTVVGP
jgi:hypothetical protein